jgi:hypothetical protein
VIVDSIFIPSIIATGAPECSPTRREDPLATERDVLTGECAPLMIVSGETDRTLLIDAPANSSLGELIYLTLSHDDADTRRGQGTALVRCSSGEVFPIALCRAIMGRAGCPDLAVPGFAHPDPWSRM